MKLSKAFKFLTILSKSIKLIYRNPKHISAIVAISLITPSILIILITYFIPFSAPDPWLWAFLPGEIVFYLTFILLSSFTRISTILVSATSYTGKTISPTELFAIIKSTFTMQTKTTSYISRITIVTAVSVTVLVFNPDVIKIAIAVLIGVSGVIYPSYLSVIWALASVVTVIERDCNAMDEVDRANALVEGQKLHGFLMNLFLNLVALLGFAVYWIAVGDKVESNWTIFVLVTVNILSLYQIFVMVAYTVFYFDCRKHRLNKLGIVFAECL